MNNKLIFLVLGLLFIGVGIGVFCTPLTSYAALATLFSITFLVNGLLELGYYITQKEKVYGYGWGVSAGLLDLVLGICLLANPGLPEMILPYFIGFMLLFRSSTIFALGFELLSLKRHNWGWYMLFGALGFLFSLFLILNPLFAAITIITWTSLSFITIGISKILYIMLYPQNIQPIL